MTIEMLEKRKRGRPQSFPQIHYTLAKDLYPDVKTRRGLQNKILESGALGVISQMQKQGITGLEFFTNDDKTPWGILRELGRYNDESIRTFVTTICEAQKNPETKRTVRQWAEWIRQTPHRIVPQLSETVSENKEAIA